jgi:hypothetical protein
MKAYSVSKVRGNIVANSRQAISSPKQLVASSDSNLTFVDSPSDADRTNLSKLGFTLVQTSKEDLYLLIGAEPDFVW